jgi:hypothetical protein
MFALRAGIFNWTWVNAGYENVNNKFIKMTNKHAHFKERKIIP